MGAVPEPCFPAGLRQNLGPGELDPGKYPVGWEDSGKAFCVNVHEKPVLHNLIKHNQY